MGIRVELGAMIRPCRTILIDEGFTACDADHIMKIPTFLGSLIDAKFSTVLIVTHIEALQNGVSNTINMQKGVRCAFDHPKSHMGNVNSDIVPEDVLHNLGGQARSVFNTDLSLRIACILNANAFFTFLP
jgi:energy-coupling factor transporter ATP-binding protein EcfA2